MLQSLTDLNVEVTVTSIDGVWAYNLISRRVMLRPVEMERRSGPRTYGRQVGDLARRGEGARRFPHAHALRIRPASALVQAQARLFGDEELCAFLDDIYITRLPGRATEAHTVVE